MRSISARGSATLFLAATLIWGSTWLAMAEQYVTSGLVAVLFSTIVFMKPIGMRLVYRTPLTVDMLMAAALGVAGVALLFLPDLAAARSDNDAGRGIANGLAGTLLASIGNITAVRNQRRAIPIFPGTALKKIGAGPSAFIGVATPVVG